jgi:hypothetical protein
MKKCAVWIAVLVTLAGAGVVPARAATTIVLPRPGQVGIGIQGGYGTLLDGGNLGRDFGNGPELTIRLRYRMRYERGFGLSFESQKLDVRKQAPSDSVFALNQLTVVLSGVDFYQLFHTRSRLQPMLSLGAGLAQYHVKLNDGEFVYPKDGLYLSAGAGAERFFFRSLAFDVSGRYFVMFQNGKTNQNLQAAAGIILYASY